MSDEKDGAVDQNEMADDWAAAMEEQTGGEESVDVDIDSINDAAKPVELDELSDDAIPLGDPKLDVILDIPVTLTMEVGSTDIAIRNLLQLSQGSVVELDRVAGEPLDVKVNGTLIAHGEVVVVNDKYGIRLTDVISPQERIKRLR
ncbi:MAG: flagellar motor switch protein FliN [Oceanospirillaceae bacterium]|nr:flagellar motor switch protein FliN [Oceanospirillaceae bacterium]